MRKIHFFIVTLFLAAILWRGLPVQAKDGAAFRYCDQATSSADVMSCVKQQYDRAAQALNNLYEEALKNQNPDQAEAFRTAQSQWLDYRDTQCGWQAARAGTETLARIKMLSCQHVMSLKRAETLAMLLDPHESLDSIVLVEEIFPRWLNVLSQQNPEIYWQHGKRQNVDLNCDGIQEYIITGLSLDAEMRPVPVLALAENPVAGRPVTYLFSATQKTDDMNGLPSCMQDISFQIDNMQAKEKTDPAVCQMQVNILSKADSCPSAMLRWQGSAPVLSIEENVNDAP